MTHRFDLNEMLDTLWNMGMDDDPVAGGWLNAELEARDGQLCDVLEWSGHGPDTVALVRWSDGVTEEIVPFGLVEVDDGFYCRTNWSGLKTMVRSILQAR